MKKTPLVAPRGKTENLPSVSPGVDNAKVAELLARARDAIAQPRVAQILHPMMCSVYGGRYFGVLEKRDGGHFIVGSQPIDWRQSKTPSTSDAVVSVSLGSVEPLSSWTCPLCRRHPYSLWVCGCCVTDSFKTIHCGGEGSHAQKRYCACGKHDWHAEISGHVAIITGQIAKAPQGSRVHGDRKAGSSPSLIAGARVSANPQPGSNRLLLPGRK